MICRFWEPNNRIDLRKAEMLLKQNLIIIRSFPYQGFQFDWPISIPSNNVILFLRDYKLKKYSVRGNSYGNSKSVLLSRSDGQQTSTANISTFVGGV